MTSSLTLTPVTENQLDLNHEIIYPQGEFWSDEPPLETYQHLQQIIILLKSL
ncbi:Uma2 family endonuclease, partial [Geminocystis sp. CENA526]